MTNRNGQIRPGDRFVKAEDKKVVWVVDRVVNFPDLPPHLRLRIEGENKHIRTFSVSAVLDGRLFQKVKSVTAPI